MKYITAIALSAFLMISAVSVCLADPPDPKPPQDPNCIIVIAQ